MALRTGDPSLRFVAGRARIVRSSAHRDRDGGTTGTDRHDRACAASRSRSRRRGARHQTTIDVSGHATQSVREQPRSTGRRSAIPPMRLGCVDRDLNDACKVRRCFPHRYGEVNRGLTGPESRGLHGSSWSCPVSTAGSHSPLSFLAPGMNTHSGSARRYWTGPTGCVVVTNARDAAKCGLDRRGGYGQRRRFPW